jgi:hypothetical protein
MAAYQMNDAAFEIPGKWRDDTTHILSHVDGEGNRLGIVVGREAATPGEELAAYVERQLKNQSQEFRAYELLGKRRSTVGGLPSIEVKYRWLPKDTMVFQHQAYVLVQGEVMSFTGSCVVKLEPSCERLMNDLLTTVRFRGG